jgi:hypothetical protein
MKMDSERWPVGQAPQAKARKSSSRRFKFDLDIAALGIGIGPEFFVSFHYQHSELVLRGALVLG